MRSILRYLQEHLMAALLCVYALGALAPAAGIAMKHLSLGQVAWFGESPVSLSLTNLLLASMLFASGLGVSLVDVRYVVARPGLLAAGVLANAAMPVLFLAALAFVLRVWPEADETQSILVGLALIGAMPIAGGAAIWVQNAEGNVPLAVGLVLASTLMSPISIPLVLRVVSHLTVGDYAEDLAALSRDGTITFSLVSVVIPCALGIAVRHFAGAARIERAFPAVKAANLIVLLLLSYSNASGALAQVLVAPDYDLLVLVLGVTVVLCCTSFYVGFRLARALGAEEPETTSLTFGVGMNNNSASSVLAATRLADHPIVLLPILAYGMIQKTIASSVDASLRKRRAQAAAPALEPA